MTVIFLRWYLVERSILRNFDSLGDNAYNAAQIHNDKLVVQQING
ncbi:MAG: hypothetical protein ACI89U_000581 [Gammaproteobacteria bacterium]|jgi:hypothetical protein